MYQDQTMYQLIKQVCNEYPNGRAIFYKGTFISYKKFLKLIDESADVLYNVLGVRKGDVILVSLPNLPDVLVLFYALNKIGAVCNLLHPLTPFNQSMSVILKTNSKLAIVFEQRVAREIEKYREIQDKVYVVRAENYLPLFSKFIYHNFMNNKIRKKIGKTRKFEGFKYYHNLKPTGKEVPVDTEYTDLAVLLHSSSTTGEPKTVCLSDIPFNYIAEHTNDYLSMKEGEATGHMMLTVLPSFHGFGLEMSMHAPLVNKMGCVLIPKFSPKEVTKALNKTKWRVACGVPTMYDKLFHDDKFVNSKYFKDIYVCYCGGDLLTDTLREYIDSRFKSHGSKGVIREGYGLAETVAVNIINTVSDFKEGSIGKAIPGTEIKIMNENSEEVPNGTIGEIVVKSPANMMKYLKDKKTTSQVLKDGWLHTGDVGYKDDEGFFYFKSRTKRIVKVSGVTVFPPEVERLIETIPNVKKACVIVIPDQKLGHVMKAIVVANFVDETQMRKTIIDTCSNYLVRWSVPKEIEFRDELPVTPFGKVNFRQLQDEENKKRGIC